MHTVYTKIFMHMEMYIETPIQCSLEMILYGYLYIVTTLHVDNDNVNEYANVYDCLLELWYVSYFINVMLLLLHYCSEFLPKK